MGKPDKIKEARDEFARLQAMVDGSYWIQESIKKIRETLKEAGADARALDPAGRKTAAEMDREIDAAAERATLANLRKSYRDFIASPRGLDLRMRDDALKEFGDTLTSLKLDLAALDETGAGTEQQIQENIAAAIQRRCLQKAREEYTSYTTSTCAGWGDLYEYLEKCIMEPLKAAGATLEDLDPEGKMPAAGVASQMQAARERLNLMQAREKFKDYEKDMSYVYADHPEEREAGILKNLAIAKKGLADLDDEDAGGEASIRARLKKAAAGTRINGARNEYDTLKKMDAASYSYSSMEFTVANLMQYLSDAGATAAALDASGRSSAKEMESDLAKVVGHLRYVYADKDLTGFEACPAPKTLNDINRLSQQLAERFNAVGARLPAETGDPDAQEKIAMRIAAAAARARELYYEAGGKMPVMKPLTFVPKQKASA